jgi:hypothetical protein
MMYCHAECEDAGVIMRFHKAFSLVDGFIRFGHYPAAGIFNCKSKTQLKTQSKMHAAE